MTQGLRGSGVSLLLFNRRPEKLEYARHLADSFLVCRDRSNVCFSPTYLQRPLIWHTDRIIIALSGII